MDQKQIENGQESSASYITRPPFTAPPPYTAVQSSAVVFTPAPPIVNISNFHETPVRLICPFCHSEVVTSTTYVSGTFAWIICAVLIFFGLWLGCCLIPFCLKPCKDVVHRCPGCKMEVGRYIRA